MAIHLALVLIIRIIRPKHHRTHRTAEAIGMPLVVLRRDVAPPERLAALCAQHVQPAKVVALAQRRLPARPVRRVEREELGRHLGAAVAAGEALDVHDGPEGPDEGPDEGEVALGAEAGGGAVGGGRAGAVGVAVAVCRALALGCAVAGGGEGGVTVVGVWGAAGCRGWA